MGAISIIKNSEHQGKFKSEDQSGFAFTPAKISEKYNLLGIVNLVLEITQSKMPTMEPSTSEKNSTNVRNLPLQEKRNIRIWGFTPSAEILNGRLAMLGFGTALLLEFFSGQGTLHFLNLL